MSQRRLARYGRTLSASQELTAASVCYLAMPMFHSNALYAGWSPAVYVGATIALRRRFSASGFLDDVRRYGATYFNYVGKPLSYILATPPRPDDRDHTLVRVDRQRRHRARHRAVQRTLRRARHRQLRIDRGRRDRHAVARSARRARSAGCPKVCSSSTRRAARRARRRASTTSGRLVNPDECIGEIVNTGPGSFEGYYKNDDAVACADPQRVVLVGRPRLRRRRRLAVVRGARLRLAARRRRELRRRAGRTHRRPRSRASCSARCTRSRRSTSATT